MKLNEKIYYYRKRAKLSQEELAARVGVSRQAVSKWELGEATPELDKLLALARVFGVTTDELLKGSEPDAGEAPFEERKSAPPDAGRQFDHAMGFFGRLIRRYGWLAGVYIAVCGLGVTVVGALARYMFQGMFAVNDAFGGLDVDFALWGGLGGATAVTGASQALATFATVILAVGVCMMIAGVVLAVILYQKGRKNS